MGRTLCVIGILLLLVGCNAQQKDNGEGTKPDAAKTGEQGADPFGRTPLHKAVAAGNVEQVRSLLEKGADVNSSDKFGDTPLHAAVSRGSVALAKLLLEKGADPNAADSRGETPLHDAVADGNAEMVKLLLEKGARADARDGDGKAPLERAKTEEMKKLLREHGAK